jgi:hypothetical protein
MVGRGYFAQRAWIAVLVCAMMCLGGCGGSDRPKTIPISGKVMIDGQPPREGGKLYFTATKVAEGYPKRPASGTFTADGKYRVMSWTLDDGLVPGHYAISVIPVDAKKTAIPAKYQQSNTSGLEVDVPVDSHKIEFDAEIRTK